MKEMLVTEKPNFLLSLPDSKIWHHSSNVAVIPRIVTKGKISIALGLGFPHTDHAHDIFGYIDDTFKLK